MPLLALFGISIAFSFGAILARYLLPELRRQSRADAMQPLPLSARSGHRPEDGERSVRIVTLSGTTPETMHRGQPDPTEASLCFLDSGLALVFIRTHPQRQPRELRLFVK